MQSSVDCLQLRVRHIDQTQSSNTHIYAYITAAQVKHNGDRSPEVPRDADPVVYTLRCISKSSLDGGGDSFLYRLYFIFISSDASVRNWARMLDHKLTQHPMKLA